MNKLKIGVTAGAISAVIGLCAMTNAHAATGNSTVTLQMNVNLPTCSITNSGTANQAGRIKLPTATFATPVNTYLGSASFGIAGAAGGSWTTSASLNQTATIACSVQNTYISSVIVQPGSSAVTVSGAPAQQYLIDGASAKAAGGALLMAFDQVSLNGTPAAYAYQTTSGALAFYNNSASPSLLSTTTANASTSLYEAYVVWRPALLASGGSTAAIGNPSGGNFSGSASVVANF
ncbi:hypothetical protein ACS0Y3_16850 [Burkholderia gladioli]|uniref:hypothetical protein n=1 Tax=Burkholderia gladioli TaxID=28095 RepID=UPI003F7AF793